MSHLFPSKVNLGGFFPARAEGLVGLIGFLPTGLVEDDAGTVLLARKAGFLWVISLLSTLRRPLVTSSPLLISAKTAAAPPPGAGAAAAALGGGGGGGGGGAPGAPAAGPEAVKGLNWSYGMPCVALLERWRFTG
jgi:hypothetical protein